MSHELIPVVILTKTWSDEARTAAAEERRARLRAQGQRQANTYRKPMHLVQSPRGAVQLYSNDQIHRKPEDHQIIETIHPEGAEPKQMSGTDRATLEFYTHQEKNRGRLARE